MFTWTVGAPRRACHILLLLVPAFALLVLMGAVIVGLLRCQALTNLQIALRILPFLLRSGALCILWTIDKTTTRRLNFTRGCHWVIDYLCLVIAGTFLLGAVSR
jgi:hypothetical protein